MARDHTTLTPSLSDQLQVAPGPRVLGALPAPDETRGFPGKGKDDAADLMIEMQPVLSDLQERLYAAARADETTARRVLVILQGMDTAGKGGVIRHVFGLVDPQGLHLKAFKKPTEEELSHDFLWRIRKGLPGPGMIGIFDRSQYEDVLVARVDKLVEESVWRARYQQINEFEAELVESGTVIIKCFLNVSRDKQRERLLERLDNPEKYWKYNPGDVDSRSKWDDYMAAYADALAECSTEAAPWYAISADHKWYRNWAVAQLVLEHLRDLDLGWPEADFDVDEERRRVQES